MRILLAEDHPDQAEFVKRILKRHDRTHEVKVATDGMACLQALSEGPYDIVILDYSLPRKNGLEVLAEMRAQGKDVPVIMVTGQGDEQIAVRAMKSGANDYIVKTEESLRGLPNILVKTVENDRLRRKVDAVRAREKYLNELCFAIATELNPETLLEKLTQGAVRLFGADASWAFLCNGGSSAIEIFKTHGIAFQPEAPKGPVAGLGLLEALARTSAPIHLEDATRDARYPGTPSHTPQMGPLIGIALGAADQLWWGGLAVVRFGRAEDEQYEGARPFEEEDAALLRTLGLQAATAIRNAGIHREAERQAITDSLTGLYNHREFQRTLREEVDRAIRYGREFTLLMIDIDRFKTVNDSYGHPVGDAVLAELASRLKQALRASDLVARYGGEEFAVILPETGEKTALMVAERLREAVAARPFATPAGGATAVTVSGGIATFPLDASEREALINAADQALYFAKNAGRNRVQTYGRTIKASIERSEEKLKELLLDPKLKAIQDLAEAVDAKSPYTRGHSTGVTQYALLLADALDLHPQEKESLRIASLLHRIGTVSVPERILNKPGPLTPEERRIVESHPALAEMMLKRAPHLTSIAPAILTHHERWDGSGYPSGLRGEEIPYLGRILAVAEAYQAMISVRPYRRRLSKSEAITQLRRGAGAQFDPRIVEAFIQALESGPG